MKDIKIHIKGLNIDATITKLSTNVKSLKDIKRIDYDQLEFCIDKSDLHFVQKYIKNYEYNIIDKTNILRKKFVASFLSAVIVLPLILFFAIMSSNFLWKIEIEGLGRLEKSDIIKLLEDNEVAVGKRITVNAKDIENLLLNNSQIAQCSCVYIGTTLVINISEKLVYNPETFEPIRAKYDGFITNLEVFRGEVNCRVGDFVHTGDILVLPYIVDREGNNISVAPKAEINGKVFISKTAILPKYEKILVPSGKNKKYIRICYTKKQKNSYQSIKPFVFYEVKVYNTYISSLLPITRQKLVFEELIVSTKTNDLVERQLENEQISKDLAYQTIDSNKMILEEKTMSVVANDTLFSTTTLTYEGSLID